MSLRERLQAHQANAQGVVVLRPEPGIGHTAYQELKFRIHQRLLDRVDLVGDGELDSGTVERRDRDPR